MSNFYCDIPLNAPTSQWMPGCASDDFKHIAIGVWETGNTGINISNDYGQTWYNPLNGLSANGSGTDATRCIACSNNFSRLTLVKENGNLFTSSDYGITWSKNTALTAKNWSHLCGSNDMTKQAAVVNGGGIWLSTNSGSTWAVSATAPTAYWCSICCSSDFIKLAAVVSNGNVYTSTDSGANWTNRNATAGTRGWRHIACSSDGGNLVATVESQTVGNVVISRDSGATWTNITLPDSAIKSYNPVACSTDFKNIIAGSYEQGNYIYSTDYGYNWTANSNGLINWHCCIAKGNNFLVARLASSQIYIGRFDYDVSPYKVNGYSENYLIKSWPVVNSSTGALVERQTDYINPFYAFDFSSGTVDGFTNQTSTGMDVNLIFERSTTSVVFKNLSSLTSPGNVFPNGNPAQVIYIPNTTTSTTPSYIQDRKATSPTLYIPQFRNVSISFWMNPITVDINGNYIVVIDISPESSSSVITIAIDGTYKTLVVSLNNLFSGNRVVTPTVVPINTWSHVVFTFNSQTQIGKLYWNGTNVSSTNYGVVLNYFKFIVIGLKYGENSQNAGKKAYNGYLAFYKMFNREITQTEVNFLYNYPGQPFTNINANSLSQIYGGLPFVRGQAPIGTSDYSKAVIRYTSSVANISDFAPFYTCYSAGGPTTHTLRSATNRILVIAIGAGGGGGGGNYQNSGTNGGAGGGGGGGGMAYTYYAVLSSDTISVTVGSGGDGGKTQVTLSGGTNYYIGGNGIGGGDSYVSVNSVEICRGYGGARSKHTSNSNTDTGVYNTSITAALNAVGGNGGDGGTYTASTNMGVSGGTNGSNGTGGASDPDNNSNSTAGGTGGDGGSSSGLTIGGQTVISNETYVIFLKSFNTVFCTGASFRTLFGQGGDGGNGEGGNNNSSAVGSGGTGGGVFIFEYNV